MGKIEDKKENKRKALEDAAYSLFCDKGLVNTSIADIVEKAGVAKGTFYLYFQDKYDVAAQLVYTVTGKIFSNAIEALSKTKILTPEDEMVMITDHIITQLTIEPTLLQYFSKAVNWEKFKEAVKVQKIDGEKNFNMLFNDMKIRYYKYELNDPEIMVFLILEFVLSACYSPILSQQPRPIEEVKPYVLDVVKEIVRLHKGSEKFVF